MNLSSYISQCLNRIVRRCVVFLSFSWRVVCISSRFCIFRKLFFNLAMKIQSFFNRTCLMNFSYRDFVRTISLFKLNVSCWLEFTEMFVSWDFVSVWFVVVFKKSFFSTNYNNCSIVAFVLSITNMIEFSAEKNFTIRSSFESRRVWLINLKTQWLSSDMTLYCRLTNCHSE